MRVPIRIIGAVALLAMTWPGRAAAAEEELVATYYYVNTVLLFKAPEAPLRKLLPEGWELMPIPSGPLKDANLFMNFSDQLAAQTPDGKAGETARLATLALPVRKKGTEQPMLMFVAGLASNPTQVPGPYGVYALAKATLDRHLQTSAAGESVSEENWQFAAENGDAVELQLKFTRPGTRYSKQEGKVYSAIHPEIHRINRNEVVTEPVRDPGFDHIQTLSFKTAGPRWSPLFDGSQQLISINSVPWATLQTFVPKDSGQAGRPQSR
jgi:hypothetical protein